jgi:hypothetical protein
MVNSRGKAPGGVVLRSRFCFGAVCDSHHRRSKDEDDDEGRGGFWRPMREFICGTEALSTSNDRKDKSKKDQK